MVNSLEPGTQLGPYEVKKQLGAGGMGEVYLAKDSRLDREVAVKILPGEFAGDAERLARFEQEARAAAALNHPHIAAVFDVGVAEDGTNYMVQEYLQGQTLRDALDGGRLPQSRALGFATEIAEALNAAHKAGIVHRDLKPANIFITEDNHAKVLDFGLAKLTELTAPGSSEASMSPTMLGTQAGEVMGTAGYMAPEQAQGEVVDHRADIFALGCVLYEMVAGRRPFEGKNVYDTIGKIVSDEPQSLLELGAPVPAELHRIVRKCLSKDSALRYQTAADAAVDLQLLQRDIDAGQADITAVAAEPTAESSTGHSASALAVVASCAVVVTSVAWWMWPTAPLPPLPMAAFEQVLPEDYPRIRDCCTREMTFARDGSFLVLGVDNDEGNERALLRRRDVRGFELLADVIAVSPTISPDGKWVVFWRWGDNATKGELVKLALAGGTPFVLTPEVWAAPFWADDGHVYLGEWDRPNVIGRVSENGGEVETIEVKGLESGVTLRRVTVLDGSEIALADLWLEREDAGIAVVDLQTGEAHRILEEGTDPRWLPSGHVLWVRGGVVYAAGFDDAAGRLAGDAVPVLQDLKIDFMGSAYMDVARDGTLAWVPGVPATSRGWEGQLAFLHDTGELDLLAGQAAQFSQGMLSPDERRIAVSIAGRSDTGRTGGL